MLRLFSRGFVWLLADLLEISQYAIFCQWLYFLSQLRCVTIDCLQIGREGSLVGMLLRSGYTLIPSLYLRLEGPEV